ncbi:MAG: hypothetical protein EP298_01715 [Gammaproteobacteria bacterium]|nr:MAG: hypothetical protein EP298_01715 [Gammaproteobacteria bacterium]UTW43922.1 hypothetical protein KFE69_07485 [bacterium SCSIO 12844]
MLINLIKLKMILSIFIISSIPIYAATKMYGTIVNNTKFSIAVDDAGSSCWYDDDLQGHHEIDPGKSWSFTTEDKDSGWNCYDDGGAIHEDHHINLKVSDPYMDRTITLSSNMTWGWSDHCTSTSTNGILIDGGCNYHIVVNEYEPKYQFTIKSFGLGEIYKEKEDPYGLDQKVYFSSVNTVCEVKSDKDGRYKSANCNHENVTYKQYGRNILFICQEGLKDDSRCPWITSNNKSGTYRNEIGNIYS